VLHVTDSNDDCIVIAIRKAILNPGETNKELLSELYDELERLAYGSITNKLCLREHTFYDAFAMVACKGRFKNITNSLHYRYV